MVVAYKNIYGEKRVIETSVSVHIATKGGKYGNPTAVTYGKSKVSVKTGTIFTLKPGLKTKTKVKTHIAKFRYESTDPSVAIVNKKGKIKGIRKMCIRDRCKARIDAARAAYDALNDTQKANISAEVLRVLKNAETAYKKAVDEAGESGGGNTETGGNESGGGNTETGEMCIRDSFYFARKC